MFKWFWTIFSLGAAIEDEARVDSFLQKQRKLYYIYIVFDLASLKLLGSKSGRS